MAQSGGEAAAEGMSALIRHRYGGLDVLRVGSVGMPSPADGEVVVRVHAASVCKGDVHLLTGKPYLLRLAGYGFLRPRNPVLGQSFAGRVVAVGRNVRDVRPGDDVFGQVDGGAFAEFVRAPAERLVPMPAGQSYEAAAAVPDSGMTALQGLRDVGRLRDGQAVLINGASGGVGTFAVQIAKSMGAEVTAVCSARHVDRVRSLGADRVVDYGAEDFARLGLRHDVFLDLVGNRSLSDCLKVLNPGGVFVSCAGSPGGQWLGPILWMFKVMVVGAFAQRRMTPFIMKACRADLLVLKRLMESGRVVPVIEKRFVLAEATEAVAHVMRGHAQGKTVITVSDEPAHSMFTPSPAPGEGGAKGAG